jgi:spectrin beta
MKLFYTFRDDYIRLKWQELLDKLEQRKLTLAGFNNLMAMFREIETIQEELKEVEVFIFLSSFKVNRK